MNWKSFKDQVGHIVCAYDRSRFGATISALVLIVLAWICLNPLLDRYYKQTFEPDSGTTVHLSLELLKLFRTGNFQQLPAVGEYPPYFDSQFAFYAGGALVGKLLGFFHLIDRDISGSDWRLMIWSVRHVNMLAHAASALLMLYTARVFTRSNIASLLIALLLLLNPQTLAIDFMRIDHVVAFLFMAVTCGSAMIAKRRVTAGLALLVGIALGALIPTKITSVAFTILPLSAFALAIPAGRSGWKHSMIFSATAFFIAATLSPRYLMNGIGGLLNNMKEKLDAQMAWSTLMPVEPYFYYSWNLMLPLGAAFVVIVGIAYAVDLAAIVKTRDSGVIWISINATVFTLLGFVSMKYSRGGYHLVPLYLLLIAACVGVFPKLLLKCGNFTPDCVRIATMTLLMALPVSRAIGNYESERKSAKLRRKSVKVTRILPAKWFKAHVPEESRVGIFAGSEWAMPAISPSNYDISSIPYPYPAKAQSATFDANEFQPPAFEELEKKFDIMLVSDQYEWMIKNEIPKYAPPDLTARWAAFASGLRQRYKAIDFTAETPNYFLTRITIFVVHPEIIDAPAPEKW